MGFQKQHLLRVVESCSEEQFGQDAIEWAILEGHVKLTGDLDADCRAVMGENGTNYDTIIEGYRTWSRQMSHAEDYSSHLEPLFAEILRPLMQPIKTTHENITTDVLEKAGQRRPARQVTPEARPVDDHCKV